MDIKKINRLIKKYIDEPHEKIILNMINIVIFSFIYYAIHLYDKNSFMINELMLLDREKQELNYYDFLYYSTLLNFTISFGDMVPLSKGVKIASAIHTFLFWYIALF
jgi:uncharacterized membrane protein|tara:strand:- start:303 stop:623 length:321 start_codon:yes stop_codon:yes gene_type:complete